VMLYSLKQGSPNGGPWMNVDQPKDKEKEAI